jgi:hypothetical protein
MTKRFSFRSKWAAIATLVVFSAIIIGLLALPVAVSDYQSKSATQAVRSASQTAGLQAFSIDKLTLQPATATLQPYFSRTPRRPLVPFPTTAFPTDSPSITPSPLVTMVPPQNQTAVHVLVVTAFYNTQIAQITAFAQATQYALITPIVPCSCTADTLDCTYADFANRSKAQACFDYCISLGVGDVHGLDYYYDGIACEDGLY